MLLGRDSGSGPGPGVDLGRSLGLAQRLVEAA